MAEDTVKKPEDEATKEREKKAVEARLAQSPVVSKGGVATITGEKLGYLATCEYLPVVKHAFGNERGEPEAAIFATAYEVEGASAATRPWIG